MLLGIPEIKVKTFKTINDEIEPYKRLVQSKKIRRKVFLLWKRLFINLTAC